MKALNIDPGIRGWLHIGLRDMALARLNNTTREDALAILKVLLERALGEYARWVAYDGETPEITVQLVRDSTMPDDAITERAVNLLRDHEARIYETLITWNDYRP